VPEAVSQETASAVQHEEQWIIGMTSPAQVLCIAAIGLGLGLCLAAAAAICGLIVALVSNCTLGGVG